MSKSEYHGPRRQDQGIALITVLLVSLVVVGILAVLSTVVVSGTRSNRDVRSRNELVQLADAVSESARVQLANSYSKSKLNIVNFLADLDNKKGQINTFDVAPNVKAYWSIRRVSPRNAKYGWADVHATVTAGNDVQTVVRRVSFGESQIFNLAMLSEKTDCMYCHIRVRGDVGSLDFLRPGWGTEGVDGHGSGGSEGGSVIRGNLYVAAKRGDAAATNVSNDSTDLNGSPRKINGAQFTGTVNLRYRGEMLPDDTNGDTIPDFPPINREIAIANARGTVAGGTIFGVPAGQTFSVETSGTFARPSVSGVYNGNLVLIGTPTNPVRLDGDIYATGDVIIKGTVTGRGAVYAGRNTYLAGNVKSANPPANPGEGRCSDLAIGAGDNQAARDSKYNTCAQRNVAASADELRLAARGNTVIGDYTERNANGDLLPWDQRQSADYYRSQFGFNSGNRYYDKATGDELTRNTDGTYSNIEGTTVAAANVITRTPNRTDPKTDAYSYSFRPGSVDPTTGAFQSWVSDSTYKTFGLGSEEYTMNSWRWTLPGKPARYNREKDKDYNARLQGFADDLKNELKNARVPDNLADKIAKYRAGLSGGQQIADDTNWGRVRIDGNDMRVLVKKKQMYETQVTNVDAFIYSNRRIAGKTSMRSMALNGGMIAKELGILAPGRTRSWWMPDWSDVKAALDDPNSASSDCGQADDAYYTANTEHCAFTVNYDYRLRNGGYGYNLVQGKVGQTMTWRIADQASEQVRP